jgi:hypothetical protein
MICVDLPPLFSLGLLQNYVSTYKYHSAAATYNGKPILSTFAGQDCSFGQGNTNNGWNAVMGGSRDSVSGFARIQGGATYLILVSSAVLLHAYIHQRPG